MVFLEICELFEKYGYQVRTGLNPYHFSCNRDVPFTFLYKNGAPVGTGGGVSVQEVMFFEYLFKGYHPQNIFVVGNAFGWSTVLLALLNPESKVVAIDACIEGDDNEEGLRLTREIARKEGLDIRVYRGFSPDDVDTVIADSGITSLDFVFIDGFHSNSQLVKDFDVCSALAGRDCVFVLHDVVNFSMHRAYTEILDRSIHLDGCILERTPSGMGVLVPDTVSDHVRRCIRYFSEHDEIARRAALDVGNLFLGNREFSRAEEQFIKAIDSNRSDEAYIGLSRSFSRRGQFKQAETALGRSRKAVSPSPEIALEVARLARLQNNFQEALVLLNRISPNDDILVDFHLEKGIVLRSLERWDDAMAELEFAAALRPDRWEPIYEQVILYRQKNDLERCQELLDQAHSLGLSLPAFLLEQALLYRIQGRLDDALTTLGAIEDDAGIEVEHLLEQGIVLRSLGRCNDAEEVLRQAHEIAPDKAEPLYELGLLLAQQELYEKAHQEWHKSLALNPAWLSPAYQLGVSYFNQGDFLTSIPLLQSVADGAQAAEGRIAARLLGSAFFHCDCPDDAIFYCRKAVPPALDTDAFRGELFAALQAYPQSMPLLVMNTCPVEMSLYVVGLLTEAGYRVLIYTHERFRGMLNLCVSDEDIVSFDRSDSFDFDELEDQIEGLRRCYRMKGAVVLYGNADGKGYNQVEKIALALAEEIVAAPTITGSFLER